MALRRSFRYNGEKAVTRMERWKKDARKEVVITDLEALVPQDHFADAKEKHGMRYTQH